MKKDRLNVEVFKVLKTLEWFSKYNYGLFLWKSTRKLSWKESFENSKVILNLDCVPRMKGFSTLVWTLAYVPKCKIFRCICRWIFSKSCQKIVRETSMRRSSRILGRLMRRRELLRALKGNEELEAQKYSNVWEKSNYNKLNQWGRYSLWKHFGRPVRKEYE